MGDLGEHGTTSSGHAGGDEPSFSSFLLLTVTFFGQTWLLACIAAVPTEKLMKCGVAALVGARWDLSRVRTCSERQEENDARERKRTHVFLCVRSALEFPVSGIIALLCCFARCSENVGTTDAN